MKTLCKSVYRVPGKGALHCILPKWHVGNHMAATGDIWERKLQITKIVAVFLLLLVPCRGEDRAAFTTVQTDPHPASPHLQTRRLAGDPFIGEDNLVHNQPSMHRNWMARHPRIMGAIAIGAAAGVGAGIARAQHRGICREGYPSGYVYVGTCPLPADH